MGKEAIQTGEQAGGEALSPDDLREMLLQMETIRSFEEAAFDQYAAGKVHGTMHLCAGQEATAVGVIRALRPDDVITSHHRGHGHAVAKGQSLRGMMAELLGKETGVCHGRGGSMHMADLRLGSMGANGIVSGGLPLSVGAGLAVLLQDHASQQNGNSAGPGAEQGAGRIVVCFFGDGAVNNGNFHESLNMAAFWQLPILFVCENNQYAMSMPVTRALPVARVSDRAAAYGMEGRTVDGMDVRAVYANAAEMVAATRQGGGPRLLELVTYRYKGHSKSDKQLYRSKEEVAEWLARDPIEQLRRALIAEGVLGEAEADALRAQAQATIDDAIAYADEQPDPDPAELTRDVYAEEPEVLAAPERVLPAWIQRTLGGATPIAPPAGTRSLSYLEALREAMDLALQEDPAVLLIGEDIGIYGGAFGVTTGLIERYGAERVRDTPISENTIVGSAVGAAVLGMRPVAEMQFMDFVALAMEQLVLQGAKIRYMFGGRATVPMVLRLPGGSGTGAAAQHSQSLEAWLVNVPGLKVVMPSTPYDAKGLLLASIADDNPVMFVEGKLLYKQKGPVPAEPYIVPLGKAEVKRPGRDVTVVATGVMVPRALAAAETLAQEGIEVEVVDPRTLKPLDIETISASVQRTGRLIVVHEAPLIGGFGGEVAAAIAQSEAFAFLEAPIVRLGGADVPVPYNRELERAMVPQVEDIADAARRIVRYEI